MRVSEGAQCQQGVAGGLQSLFLLLRALLHVHLRDGVGRAHRALWDPWGICGQHLPADPIFSCSSQAMERAGWDGSGRKFSLGPCRPWL